MLDEDGILQTENNLIYIAETKDADGKITSRKLVVKPYPNAIKATLCAFSENGIVAQFELDVPSPIVISQTKTEIRADQQEIGLKTLLLINVVGKDDPVTSFNLKEPKLEAQSGYEGIAELSENTNSLTIKPYAGKEFKITISVSVYGADLPGTNEGTLATATFTYTIKPNIVVNDNTTSVYANDENFQYKIVNNNIVNNNLFIGGNFNYTYSVVDVTSTLEQPELNLYREEGATVDFTTDDFKNFIIGKFDTETKTLKFKPLAVSANRTVVVTFKISKGTFEATAKLTITIKPDCNVSPNYPDHGTGQVMDSHLVYYGDYVITFMEKGLVGDYFYPEKWMAGSILIHQIQTNQLFP